MNSALVPCCLEDVSPPATLRSPPSSLRVKDRACLVEVQAPLANDYELDQDGPPTLRYDQVA